MAWKEEFRGVIAFLCRNIRELSVRRYPLSCQHTESSR